MKMYVQSLTTEASRPLSFQGEFRGTRAPFWAFASPEPVGSTEPVGRMQ